MDFVNQTIAQLRDLFASMSPGARVTAGLLLAVVVASCGFLFQQAASGADEFLFGAEPLAASQIARMEGAMAKAGLSEFVTEGNHIRVPRAKKAEYIAAIADAGELPPDYHRMMADAIDGGSVFDSRDVKRQRIKAAREKQLSHVIGLMPWVDQAIVIYDDREESGLKATRSASAAVSVLPKAGEVLDSRRVRNLRDFVARSCNMLDDEVSVTNLGNDAMVGSDGVGAEDFDHPYYATKAKIERKLRGELIDHLSYIPGVRVQVKASLDNTRQKTTVQVKPEEKTAELSSTTRDETVERVTGGGGGQIGLEAQGPNREGRDDTVAKQEQDKTSRNDESRDFVVGSSTTQTAEWDSTLKEAEASIAVPRSYVASVFRERAREAGKDAPKEINPDELAQLEGEVKLSIENLVQPLLPKLALGENEFKQVKVEFYYDLPRATLPEPSVASTAFGWASDNASSIAMGGFALVSLVMLRSMASGGAAARLGPANAPTLRLETGSDHADGVAAADGDDLGAARPKLKLKRGDSLKDDLTEMVTTDPDAAAAILRSWIQNAG
ncbi:MAG: flagellar M-ring protein FliF C-terminal domain-containing protein [Lacipirellulaceae bacterium]